MPTGSFGELFAIFQRSGLYLNYARRYMQAQQLDAVDIDSLLDSPRNPQQFGDHSA